MVIRGSSALVSICLFAAFSSLRAFQGGSSRFGQRSIISSSAVFSLRAEASSDSTAGDKTKKSSRSILGKSRSKVAKVDSTVNIEEALMDVGYSSQTVIQLKGLLKERGLPVSGVKAELILRLEEADTANAPAVDAFDIEDFLEEKKSKAEVKKTYSPSFSVELTDSKPTSQVVVSVSREETRVGRSADIDTDGNIDDGDSEISIATRLKSSFRRGDKIKALILRYGPLGASVQIIFPVINDQSGKRRVEVNGLILQGEIKFYAAANGDKEPRENDVVDAYIQNIRDDGKVDVALRPIGYEKVTTAADQLLKALEASSDGALPLGDRSTPEEVWALFPGMSKGQYKTAVGALLRDGSVITSETQLTLVPKGERKPMAAEPWNGKSPRGWRAPDGATLFVGNIPFAMDKMKLASAIERRTGYGKLASVRISTDPVTERGRGFAYADFFNSDYADEALKLISGLVVEGRELRVDAKVRVGRSGSGSGSSGDVDGGERKEVRNWGDSSLRGPKVYGAYENDKKDDKKDASGTWCSVYVGNLPYKVTEESLRYNIESSLSDGVGTVADVRIAEEEGTGRKKGFAFVDFIDEPSAARAVSELNGMSVMGRPIKLDMEGLKLRDRERRPENSGQGNEEGAGSVSVSGPSGEERGRSLERPSYRDGRPEYGGSSSGSSSRDSRPPRDGGDRPRPSYSDRPRRDAAPQQGERRSSYSAGGYRGGGDDRPRRDAPQGGDRRSSSYSNNGYRADDRPRSDRPPRNPENDRDRDGGRSSGYQGARGPSTGGNDSGNRGNSVAVKADGQRSYSWKGNRDE